MRVYVYKHRSRSRICTLLDQNAVYAAHFLIKMPSMQPITFLKTPKHLTHLVNADSSTADGLSYTRFTHGESSVVEDRRRTGAGFVGDGWSSIFWLMHFSNTRT